MVITELLKAKVCHKCKILKPGNEFYLRKSGITSCCCKKCHALGTTINQRKRYYGINPDDYAKLLEQQSGVCKICGGTSDQQGTKKRTLAVDHNHQNGKIRGLLCGSCNRAIGLLKDDIANVLKVADYLFRDGE